MTALKWPSQPLVFPKTDVTTTPVKTHKTPTSTTLGATYRLVILLE